MVILCKQCRSSVLFITMQIVWELFTQFVLSLSLFLSLKLLLTCLLTLVRLLAGWLARSLHFQSACPPFPHPLHLHIAYCNTNTHTHTSTLYVCMHGYMNTMIAAIVYHFNNNNNNNGLEHRARNRVKNFITLGNTYIMYEIYERYTMKATDNCLICCRCCLFGISRQYNSTRLHPFHVLPSHIEYYFLTIPFQWFHCWVCVCWRDEVK